LEGGGRVTLEIAGPSDDIVTRLSALQGVREATAVGLGDGRYRVDISTVDGGDIRPLLASTVVAAGWMLFQMTSSTMSLEDIFLKLTTDDEGHSPRTPSGGVS